MAQKGLWNLAREKILRESDAIGEYKAMPEDNFLSSWLREDGGEKENGW